MSVRETLESYASGEIEYNEAVRQLRIATWRPTRRSGNAELHGVRDTPPPPDNSPDWIQIIAGLTPQERTVFTQIYDNRRSR